LAVSNLAKQIIGESRPTHVSDMIGRISKTPGLTKVSSWYQGDGAAVLLRDEDGQAYEITIRPAAYAQHPSIKDETGAGRGTLRPRDKVRFARRDRSPKRLPLP
jgi:hypothetical protein